MHANSELQKFYIGIEIEQDKIKASIITMIFPMASHGFDRNKLVYPCPYQGLR